MQLEQPESLSFAKAMEIGNVVKKEGYHYVPQNYRYGPSCNCQKMTEKGAYRDVVIEVGETTLYYYHQNLIVTEARGIYRLSSCGWYTSTTKERINRYLPRGFRLYQNDYEWYISTPDKDCQYDGKDIPFSDGMLIHENNEFIIEG